jgi:hypothetical protein
MWTFRGYIDGRGGRELTDWFEALTPENQASVLTSVEHLAKVERDYWKRPQFDTLRSMDGMGEIILGKIGGIQTRLVGFFGPTRTRHLFTVVLIVTKRMQVYSPKDWENVSKRRRDECEINEDRTYVWHP